MVFALLGRRENLCAPQRGGVLLLLEEERNGCAPQRGGVFSPLERGGERLRPTFLFLLREKKKRAAPGTKKKSAGSGFRDESCSFFVCALRPDSGCLGAVRTGFTTCAAAANGCGEGSFSVVRN